MVAEYYVVRRYRAELEQGRRNGRLPATVELINPVILVSWLAGSLVGHYVNWAIPALNALITSLVLYVVLSLLADRLRIPRLEGRTEAAV
jgi:cytosine permease